MRFNTFMFVAVVAQASVTCFAAGDAASQSSGDCGNPFEGGGYGPFDYRTATRDQKTIVEANHFTATVESLRGGITGSIGAELDYTLRAFPNHPRALMAMIRLAQREKVPKPRGALYTLECYVERAIEFRPDDISIRQVRGIYYTMRRSYDQAIADFAAVIEQQPDNANAHYNLGLAYFEIKNYDRAREEAKAAQTLGFALEGLKKKLKAVGKWNE